MRLTNKFNLPQAVVDAVEPFPLKDGKSFSVTQILNSPKCILLRRRHWEELESDVSDMINMMFGSAVHKYLQDHDKTKYSEYYLKQEIFDGWCLTGVCDLYDEENFTLVDYKTCSVWKIIKGEFEDWKLQGLMYAWMLIKQGKLVNQLKFHALLKDWTAKDSRADSNYPKSQVYTWEYRVDTSELVYIENYVKEKFAELIKWNVVEDNAIPECSEEDRWYTGDTWKVYKHEGDKKALRVFKTQKEAEDYNAGIGGIVIYFKGEDRKCQDYCDVCRFCNHYVDKI